MPVHDKTDTYDAVKVHIASSDVGQASPYRCKASYETFVLTANDPVMPILPEDPDRECAFIQAIDNDIVIGPTRGVVGAAVNTVTSVPNPNGTYIPKANTAPYPIHDSNAVFAGVTTTSSASRVSVSASYRIRE